MSYLLSVAHRLKFLPDASNEDLAPRCTQLSKSLIRLIASLDSKLPQAQSPLEPKA
jgi:hypothetical protein